MKVAVLGLSRTGLSAIKSLITGKAKEIYTWDDRVNPPSGFEITHLEPKLYPWSEIAVMVVSPGIPVDNPHVKLAIQNRCPIVSDIQLFCQTQSRAKIIGITGTNGKSTITTLIYQMLLAEKKQVECGGNIGLPCLSLKPHQEYYVLEISSFQLELCEQLRLNMGVLVNIQPDHMERLADIKDYAAMKRRIFDNPKTEAIINVDHHYCKSIYSEINNQKIPISTQHPLKKGAALLANDFYMDGNLVGEVKTPEFMVKENAAITALVALKLGINLATVNITLQRFKGLPHRCEMVSKIKNITVVNDSKATNLHAMSNALKTYKNIYLISGGILKDNGYDLIAYENIRHIYAFGRSKFELNAVFKGKVPVTICTTLECATKQAFEASFIHSKSEDVTVLLSPGCASFDQFKNFEERGDKFKEIASSLLVGYLNQ